MTNFDARTVFACAMKTFHRVSRESCHVRYFRIGNHTICLRIANCALTPILTRAFSHLEPADGKTVDLTICAWDDHSTGDHMLEPPSRTGSTGIEFIDGELRVAWSIAERSLSVFSASSKLAFFRIPDARTVPAWEQAAPFRRILHWWASKEGLQMVHAAGVGTPAGGVLLVGKGGSGKSTTALACVGSQLGYAADDYCLLSPGIVPKAHSIYGSGKADANSIVRLPKLQTAFESSQLREQKKSVIFVEEHIPDTILRSFPLRGIVVPRVTGGNTHSVERISKSEAFRAMAPSTLFQMPGDQPKSLARMASMTRQLPSWSLSIGEDPGQIPSLLDKLMRT